MSAVCTLQNNIRLLSAQYQRLIDTGARMWNSPLYIFAPLLHGFSFRKMLLVEKTMGVVVLLEFIQSLSWEWLHPDSFLSEEQCARNHSTCASPFQPQVQKWIQWNLGFFLFSSFCLVAYAVFSCKEIQWKLILLLFDGCFWHSYPYSTCTCTSTIVLLTLSLII
jgi:hypothetical protein